MYYVTEDTYIKLQISRKYDVRCIIRVHYAKSKQFIINN